MLLHREVEALQVKRVLDEMPVSLSQVRIVPFDTAYNQASHIGTAEYVKGQAQEQTANT